MWPLPEMLHKASENVGKKYPFSPPSCTLMDHVHLEAKDLGTQETQHIGAKSTDRKHHVVPSRNITSDSVQSFDKVETILYNPIPWVVVVIVQS